LSQDNFSDPLITWDEFFHYVSSQGFQFARIPKQPFWITGDFVAGMMLISLLSDYQNDRKNHDSDMYRDTAREDTFWVSASLSDWWERLGISKYHAEKGMKILRSLYLPEHLADAFPELKDQALLETDYHTHNGYRRGIHRLNQDVLMVWWKAVTNLTPKNPKLSQDDVTLIHNMTPLSYAIYSPYRHNQVDLVEQLKDLEDYTGGLPFFID
jgi:hypothetical protein